MPARLVLPQVATVLYADLAGGAARARSYPRQPLNSHAVQARKNGWPRAEGQGVPSPRRWLIQARAAMTSTVPM